MRIKTITERQFNRAHKALMRNLYKGNIDAYLVTRNGKKHRIVLLREVHERILFANLKRATEESWERMVELEIARLNREESRLVKTRPNTSS